MMSLLTSHQKEILATKALEAKTFSYSPYSHYQVGAALLCNNGVIYTGCNIENAGYGPTNCAERTAFFKAVSEGEKEFSMIAVVGGAETANNLGYCSPCGVCRQVMMEFCNPQEFMVIMAKNEEEYKVMSLAELVPEGFGPGNLG